MYCAVYLVDAPYHIDRPFDYSVPDKLKDQVFVGAICKVPFGKNNSLRTAVIVSIKDKPDADGNIKPVHLVNTDRFSLNEEMLGLCLFLKEYTLCTFGDAVRTVLPPGALFETTNVKVRKTYSLALSHEAAATLLLSKSVRSEGQRNIIRYLLDIEAADRELVKQLPGVSGANISALVGKGIIEEKSDIEYRNPYTEYAKERDTSEIVLSRAQNTAFDTISGLYSEAKPNAALLYGVTGSGKTKVIMKLIDRVILDKKSVIMLVPEISLTPQTVSIFCKRYGERVAVIHSSLSQGERLDAYRRIREGLVDLVIGTRSAIFAPLSNLGLIVIDEEHEHTYKSESDPKYHARDIAAYRCGKNNSLMLLASATPSIESFYKAKCGSYTLVPLRERYGNATLPDAVIVDMRQELRLGNPSPISDRLLRSLERVDEEGEQAILFLNRRGYNSQVSCKSCGEVVSCPRCSVSLTYHRNKDGGRMLCHLCGYSEPKPGVCKSCLSDNLSFLGSGTQMVENDLEKYIPSMSVMRMDADTTSGKLAYDRLLESFRKKEADILLGTQMVAKGHDFPDVTLVGVVLADTSLYVSDFRASERTFSLLTQVIGRAGRSRKKGTAVIQTFSPKHEIIRLACMQDYDKFYEGEIALRKELDYPPFCDMVTLTLTSDDESKLLQASAKLKDSAIKKLENDYKGLPFVLFGPFEAQVYKLNEKYRMKAVVKCRLNKVTRKFFHSLLVEFANERGVTLSCDLNPQNV